MQTDRASILIVEDSETQAVLLSSILEQNGWQAEWVATAEAALELLANKSFSMVIVDYHLPGMDGDQLCRNIKLNIRTRGVPILMLTIEGSTDSERYALESGADAFAPKESDQDVLVARIRSLLDRSERNGLPKEELRPLHRSRILAVDDSPTYLTFLQESFKLEGIDLETADSGKKALELVQRRKYDCILLDLVMPEMDGIAVCQELLRQKVVGEKIFVVMMLTAHEGKQEMMSALNAGADDFVGKSNDISIVKARVAALLRRRYIQMENQKIWRELKEKELEAERARIEKEVAEEKAFISQQLKDSEERFRKIFENNSDGVLILDTSGKLLMINSAGELLLNKSKEELLRNPFTFESGNGETESVEIEDSENKKKIVEIRRADIPWGADEACLLTMRNVTEREEQLQKTADNLKEAMTKLTDSQSQLIEAEKLGALGVLTAGIAHELNNPMMGILNYTQYCAKHVPTDNKAFSVLEDIERETQRCIEIVRNLLTFSRIEKVGEEKIETIHCTTILDRVLNLLKYRIEKENVTVIKSGEDSIPEFRVRTSNLQQVFLNLIGNALDALIDAQDKTIRIAMHREDRWIAIDISDNGSGIQEELMVSIFDPFFTTKEPGKGTGLGLSVSKSIVEAHSGKMSCKSESGKGTTFSVRIPMQEV